jgi:uncharacterized protein HemY
MTASLNGRIARAEKLLQTAYPHGRLPVLIGGYVAGEMGDLTFREYLEQALAGDPSTAQVAPGLTKARLLEMVAETERMTDAELLAVIGAQDCG